VLNLRKKIYEHCNPHVLAKLIWLDSSISANQFMYYIVTWLCTIFCLRTIMLLTYGCRNVTPCIWCHPCNIYSCCGCSIKIVIHEECNELVIIYFPMFQCSPRKLKANQCVWIHPLPSCDSIASRFVYPAPHMSYLFIIWIFLFPSLTCYPLHTIRYVFRSTSLNSMSLHFAVIIQNWSISHYLVFTMLFHLLARQQEYAMNLCMN